MSPSLQACGLAMRMEQGNKEDNLVAVCNTLGYVSASVSLLYLSSFTLT